MTKCPRRAWVGVGVLAALAGCSGRQDLGPADAYVLLAPVKPPASSPRGLPVVEKLDVDQAAAATVERLLAEGFAAEMVGTVHLAKQLARAGAPGGRKFAPELRARANEPLALLVGMPSQLPQSRGLAFTRMFGAADERPELAWVGLPATFEDDTALVQTLSGKLAAHAADWIAGGASSDKPSPLVEAFRMAMEVIAREWRLGKGSRGTLPTTAGSVAQRYLFADIRENRAVLVADENARAGTADLRPPAELLSDPKVAATVLYRLAQTKTVGSAVAPPVIYGPFVRVKLPDGVHGAQVLGPIRNFNAKLLSAWATAVLAGHPPADLVDLLQAYMTLFPAERKEVLRIFLVTTYAGTVKPGGISRKPEQATAALAEVAVLTNDLLAGKRTLRDAAQGAVRK